MRLINQHPDNNNTVTIHSTCQLACSCIEGPAHVCRSNHTSNSICSTSPQPSTSTLLPWSENYEPSTSQYEDALLSNAFDPYARNYIEWQENKEKEYKADDNAFKRKSPEDNDSLSDSETFPKMLRNNEGVAEPSVTVEPPCSEYNPDEYNPFEFGLFEHASREEIPDAINSVQHSPTTFAIGGCDDPLCQYDNNSIQNAYDPDEFVPDEKIHTNQCNNYNSDTVSIISITSTEAPSPESGLEDITFDDTDDDDDYDEEEEEVEQEEGESDDDDDEDDYNDEDDEDDYNDEDDEDKDEDEAVTSTTSDTNDGMSCNIY